MSKSAGALILSLLLLFLGACDAGPAPGGAQTSASASLAASEGPSDATPRKLIRRGELELELTDVQQATGKATERVTALGGRVDSSSLRPGSRSRGGGGVQLVLRVPNEHFDQLLGELRQLAPEGGVLREQTSTEDVTDRHVDLSARLKAQRALESRYLLLLERAENVPEMLAVQKELGSTRTEIERLQGKLKQLDSSVAFATVQLELVESAPLVRASLSDLGSSFGKAAGDAITVGLHLLTGGVRLLGVLLPVFLLVLLPLGLVLRWGLRRTGLTGSPAKA